MLKSPPLVATLSDSMRMSPCSWGDIFTWPLRGDRIIGLRQSKILDCADVGTCGMLSVITSLEFFQHYFSELGHRDLLVTQNLSQAIEQQTLHYLTRSVRRRAATSKRANRKSGSRYRRFPATRSDTYQNTCFDAGYTKLSNLSISCESQGRVAAPFDTHARSQD